MNLVRYELVERSDANLGDWLSQVAPFSNFAAVVVDGSLSRYSDKASTILHELSVDMELVEPGIDRWPGTVKLTEANATRYIFRINAHSVGVLHESADSLFDWHNRDLPEDLHFLRGDGTLVLGCIAHERYAWVELSPEERSRWEEGSRFPLLTT